MLSIIVSSYQPHFFSDLKSNIAETCGIPYEIIKIHNPGTMGICQSYNLGAKQAKFSNLLFIHEDILFVNKGWGEKLVETLQIPDCGIVGVAGGNYYSYIPATWSNKGYNSVNFIQVVSQIEQYHSNFGKKSERKKVKGIDGVLLACKKNIFDEFKFNEDIRGYHGYDLIFSLSVAKKYTNYITNEILIKHFSSGNFSKEWFENILKVREIIGTFQDQKTDQKVERENFYKFIFYLKNFNYSQKDSFKIAIKYINLKKFGVINSLKMIYQLKHLVY